MFVLPLRHIDKYLHCVFISNAFYAAAYFTSFSDKRTKTRLTLFILVAMLKVNTALWMAQKIVFAHLSIIMRIQLIKH